jgi:hypothetical protein
VQVAGFLSGSNTITYINKINRSGSGALQSFEYLNNYPYIDCSNFQQLEHTGQINGIFTVQTINGLKKVRYLDTLSSGISAGNQNCAYTVYFDNAGRMTTKVVNGIQLVDDRATCTRFDYFPVNDTTRQFVYDAATGQLMHSFSSEYAGHFGSVPQDVDRQRVITDYQYDKMDNHKISQFFSEYRWGPDLSSWFTYGFNNVAGGTGVVDGFFPSEFENLKYGICEKINITEETVSRGVVIDKLVSDYTFKRAYDSKGNLIRYSIAKGAIDSYYYEFIYK